MVFIRTTLMMIMVVQGFSAFAESYADREDVKKFADELAELGSFTSSGVLTVFRQAEYKQKIIDAISRPAERTLDWGEYQDIFLTKSRVSNGRSFMETYKDALSRARKEFGVPPVIITAVIGVETMYGRYLGNYRVLDALTTLAFDYPKRSRFFRRELREFFILVQEDNHIIMELKGSYAGAMGYGQFIPSSYRRYAVDFDYDGVKDIWNNPVDAIGSVANYLSEHGWKKGQIAVQVDADDVAESVFNVSLRPSSTVVEMQRLGVKVNSEPNVSVSPMKLLGKDGAEYWLGFNNFYVITRYNHSKLYAMAVFQLSEALRKSVTDQNVGSYR